MSEIDKTIQAFTASQKIIERMISNTFSSIINQQSTLLNTATASIRFSNAFSRQYTLPPRFFSGLEQYEKLSKAISSSVNFDKITAQMANAFTFPITRICKDLSVLSQQEFQSAINPLLSYINSIYVSPDYVEVPEISKSEQMPKVASEVLSQTSSIRKKLTRSDVVSLITFLLALLSWLFPNPLSNFQENTDVATFSITQEQGEQIINCLVSLTEYLENHPEKTSHATYNHQEPDLLPSNSQLDIATPDSASLSIPEAGSKPDNTESNLKAE